MIDILHLHGFKSAGTTFSWILERNYRDKLIYVESEQPGDRLPWQRVGREVDLGRIRAVSSHLVTVPDEGNGFARLSLALVRRPQDRLRSAYRYQKAVGTLQEGDETFGAFLARIERSSLANYQTRHLSPQDHGGWARRNGWDLRPDLIRLDRADMLVGIVERFDETMVVLEYMFEGMGIVFDGAYPRSLNASAEATQEAVRIPRNLVEIDETLWELADEALTRRIGQVPDSSRRLRDFNRRCAELGHAFTPGDALSVQPPQLWTYLPTSKGNGGAE